MRGSATLLWMLIVLGLSIRLVLLSRQVRNLEARVATLENCE